MVAATKKEIVRVPAGRAMRPAESGPDNFLAVIAAAAADPRCDVSKMQALLQMQRDVTQEAARMAFTKDFIALQKDLPSINRDGRIEIKAKDARGERTGSVQQSTPYATFNAIHKAIKPLLTKHGFALSFATEPSADGTRIMVKTILDHEQGHQRATTFPLPAEVSGSKNNVQGWGSSMSYGRRYGTIALLNIVSHAPEDRDDDGHGNPNLQQARDGGLVEVEDEPKVSEAQKTELLELIEWCGVGKPKFCDHYGIKTVGDLPAILFDSAAKSCRDYHANQQAKRG